MKREVRDAIRTLRAGGHRVTMREAFGHLVAALRGSVLEILSSRLTTRGDDDDADSSAR